MRALVRSTPRPGLLLLCAVLASSVVPRAGAPFVSGASFLPGAEESETRPPAPDSKSPGLETDADVAARVRPSVLVIRTAGRDGSPRGVGSGFAISEDLIATNYHVVGEGRAVTFRLADGRELVPIELHAVDREKDLAIVRVRTEDGRSPELPPLELGDVDNARPGDRVVAVGNPLGFDFSVSSGVIAERRNIDGRDLLQVAMPLEPGSSGSPVVSSDARVLGVLAIKSGTSLGFAVPSSALATLLATPRPTPWERWLRIGRLDERLWNARDDGATWRQRAGRIHASGQGEGFGGRTLRVSTTAPPPDGAYEVAVDVKLADESGAAGLVFASDDGDRHHGFYPTAGAMRLTRFEGPTVYQWTILTTLPSTAYRPQEWNRLRVRIDGERISAFVNEELVTEITDPALASAPRGHVGLCKFRSPEAEFRRFSIARDLSVPRIDSTARARILELATAIAPSGPPDDAIVEELAGLPEAASRLLEDEARRLEASAFRTRHLAGLVRQRGVENTLRALFFHADGEPVPEAAIDLARAALLVARLDQPELEIESYVDTLDHMARAVQRDLAADASASDRLVALRKVFSDELGFRGSRLEYYHRSNSYLNEVLDDREGLPITLSIVFLELARRLEIPAEGVAIPRHFVVATRVETGAPALLDVFDGAREITLAEASALSGTLLREQDVTAARKRDIIVRVLRNLSGVAQAEGDVPAVLRYLDAMLVLAPEDELARWERALLRSRTGQPRQAVEDLEVLRARPTTRIDSRQIEALRAALAREGF